jgi:hypothetical protein
MPECNDNTVGYEAFLRDWREIDNAYRAGNLDQWLQRKLDEYDRNESENTGIRLAQ